MKQTIALLASTQDVASMNVYQKLITTWKKTELKFEDTPVYYREFETIDTFLCLTNKKSVYCEHIDQEIEVTINKKISALIFITKHDSKSGRPSFSVHTQGNWNTADLGGNPHEIALCPVILKHTLYQTLLKNNNLPEFETVNECTHHGPSVTVPSMFIEIGSTKNEWERQDAGIILANSIIMGLEKYKGEQNPDNTMVIIGLGGTHTCSNFARLINENKAYLSHVCPEYAINGLTANLIQQALAKSSIPATIVIDWKGMSGPQRSHVLSLLAVQQTPYQKLNEIKAILDKNTNPK